MPVLTTDAQRQGLAAILATVPGMGIVHQRRRVIRDEQAVRDLLCPSGSDKINAWMIYPSSAATTVTTRGPGHRGIGVSGGGNDFTAFQWLIDAYYQLDDASSSESVFYDLAWEVVRTVNSYGLLAITGLTHQGPMDIEQFGFANVAGVVLTHYARLQVMFQGRPAL